MYLLKRNGTKMKNSKPIHFYWLIPFVIILLSGCMVGPKYTAPPQLDIPCEWHSPLSPGMEAEQSNCFLWWESLGDPLLNSLIERAAVQNLDLYLACTRILEARAEEKGGEADLYPHIDGSATYGHVQYNKNVLNRILDTENSHHKGGKRNLNFFEFGFDAEWEIDLFGMRAHEINALKAKIEASQEDFCHIWVTLAAEIVKNYIELRSLQHRLDVIYKNIRTQNETLKLTTSLITAGFASSIDEFQAKEQLNTLSAEKPLIQLAIDKTIHRLSILVGYNPNALFCELYEPHDLPMLPYEKPVGIPSELLRRRPDIKKAERELAAATERVGSAVAALFPRLTLEGFIGNIGTFCSNGLTWFSGSQLLLPIFNSKLLQQDIDYNKIKARQAVIQYQKTVVEALEEAENAIAAFHYELNRNHQLAEARKASQEAYQLTYQLYTNGFKNYLDVLVTNRSLLAADEAYLKSQSDLLFNYIALYKALGGGWDTGACECKCK